ncbi:MAG: glycosyltransferase [Candidatus Helarchaeota archaeon]
MKNILYTTYYPNNLHTLWKSFIFTPPNGYSYYDLNGKLIKESVNLPYKSFQTKTKQTKIFQFVKRHVLTISRINQKYKDYYCHKLGQKVEKLSPDIVYCINGDCIKNNYPWVVDLEHIGAFTFNFKYNTLRRKGYRDYIENILKSEYCKFILPYSETSKKSLLFNLNCNKFLDKIKIVPNVVKIKKNVEKIPHETFNILFTGSSQNPDEFFNRGGKEVITSFLKIVKKFPKTKLICRCMIPKNIKNIIISHKNVEIYENPISLKKFETLFLKSDLYIFPAYGGYAMSILDAMNYELPIITTDFLENADKVINGYNGFKLPLGKNNPGFFLPFVPIKYSIKYQPKLDRAFINSICKKIQFLYENESERIKMGKNSKKILEKEFSLDVKNRLLKKIFDKI